MDLYSVGDKLKITDHYIVNYPAWNVQGKEATVVMVKKVKVLASGLLKEDKAMFQAKYGIQHDYEMYELHVELDGHRYIVSQFGFDK